MADHAQHLEDGTAQLTQLRRVGSYRASLPRCPCVAGLASACCWEPCSPA